MITSPFTVLIDSMEQYPFRFTGITADASKLTTKQKRAVEAGVFDPTIDVQTAFRSLGASNGDYSIDGFTGRCHIERKSMEDCHGTVLGWGDRRERFKRELDNLANMESAAVVIECSFGDLLANAPEHGRKTAAQNRKLLFRQIISWQQKFRVHWLFCDSRQMAEITTYRWFERFWVYQQQQAKREMECHLF